MILPPALTNETSLLLIARGETGGVKKGGDSFTTCTGHDEIRSDEDGKALFNGCLSEVPEHKRTVKSYGLMNIFRSLYCNLYVVLK